MGTKIWGINTVLWTGKISFLAAHVDKLATSNSARRIRQRDYTGRTVCGSVLPTIVGGESGSCRRGCGLSKKNLGAIKWCNLGSLERPFNFQLIRPYWPVIMGQVYARNGSSTFSRLRDLTTLKLRHVIHRFTVCFPLLADGRENISPLSYDQSRIYSQQGPVQKKMWSPSPGAAAPFLLEKNWWLFCLVITVRVSVSAVSSPEKLATFFCSSLSFTRGSPIILQKFAAFLWGPLFVGPLFGQTCLNPPLRMIYYEVHPQHLAHNFPQKNHYVIFMPSPAKASCFRVVRACACHIVKVYEHDILQTARYENFNILTIKVQLQDTYR